MSSSQDQDLIDVLQLDPVLLAYGWRDMELIVVHGALSPIKSAAFKSKIWALHEAFGSFQLEVRLHTGPRAIIFNKTKPYWSLLEQLSGVTIQETHTGDEQTGPGDGQVFFLTEGYDPDWLAADVAETCAKVLSLGPRTAGIGCGEGFATDGVR